MTSRARQSRADLSFGARPEPPPRACDHPGCDAAGEFRAPKSRSDLRSYYWFCLDHVRAYNQSWNYFAGMNEDEVESHTRAAVCWDRPTWKLGHFASLGVGRIDLKKMRDGFRIFEDEELESGGRGRAHPRFAPGTPEARAMHTLGLEGEFTKETLKSRYKALAKQHHPDHNPGDKAAEDRLKDINQAYRTLLDSLNVGHDG